jgi:hypothetical protein
VSPSVPRRPSLRPPPECSASQGRERREQRRSRRGRDARRRPGVTCRRSSVPLVATLRRPSAKDSGRQRVGSPLKTPAKAHLRWIRHVIRPVTIRCAEPPRQQTSGWRLPVSKGAVVRTARGGSSAGSGTCRCPFELRSSEASRPVRIIHSAGAHRVWRALSVCGRLSCAGPRLMRAPIMVLPEAPGSPSGQLRRTSADETPHHGPPRLSTGQHGRRAEPWTVQHFGA